MAKMRLDRLLAGQGTQTRKEVRELIRKGRVTVNGQPEKSADRQVELQTDQIEVDGVPLQVREHLYHRGGSGAARAAPQKPLPGRAAG